MDLDALRREVFGGKGFAEKLRKKFLSPKKLFVWLPRFLEHPRRL